MSDPVKKSTSGRTLSISLLALAILAACFLLFRQRGIESGAVPHFSIPIGKVRPALPTRIVSFHRGRADKNLIKLASQLGFNGVQFQIEGSNEAGIREFAARDANEHLVDYCHSLGMKVTVWVHEVSDMPSLLSPNYPGPVSVDNQKIWDILEQRYEWILKDAIPAVDGLVLTTVETQVNATDSALMLKLVNLIDRKCREHGKSLIVRTFVWRPDELESVMGAVKKMPEDITVMTKIVAQDWQMRGTYAAELGAVGGRPQIVEFDVAGEYFLTNSVANCMVDLLHRQFDYAVAKGAQGICVRVDRGDDSVLFEPSEVNLWALGMLAAGATSDGNEIWNRWATYRYGASAAPGIVKTLKPTSEVIAEMLSVGPFTLGDTRLYSGATRSYLPQPTADIFSQNWQNWKWDPAKYSPIRDQAETGDSGFVAELQKQKAAALALAEQSLRDLEDVRSKLTERDYRILYTRLISNKAHLQFRTIVALAAEHYRQYQNAKTPQEIAAAAAAYKKDMADAKTLADSLHAYPKMESIQYAGKWWQVNYPPNITPEEIIGWANGAQKLIQ
ncbi:MAG TPA: hypothetical protein VHM90_16785 [Phycisphaerae bacterium]|nr:hypothetical protein [Phycisphaerae bacterium]